MYDANDTAAKKRLPGVRRQSATGPKSIIADELSSAKQPMNVMSYVAQTAWSAWACAYRLYIGPFVYLLTVPPTSAETEVSYLQPGYFLTG